MKRFGIYLKAFISVGLAVLILAGFKMSSNLTKNASLVQQTNQSLKGAWRLVKTTSSTNLVPDMVKIIADNSFTFAAYDLSNKKFLGAGGGIIKLEKGKYTETLEYFTEDSTKVGSGQTYTYALKGKILESTTLKNGKKVVETWEQIDNGTGQKETLAGAWRIRERETQPRQMSVIQRGPRKTIKWLSGTRFQWAAINTETKQFFGTGGGRYTLNNGKYTEHIDFFSRDSKRVGMNITFDYEIKNGDWHHRGLSTTGNKIYEIWTLER